MAKSCICYSFKRWFNEWRTHQIVDTKVWTKRRGLFSNATGRTLLVMDAHRAHVPHVPPLTSETIWSAIPGGMRPLVEPLDLSVNGSVKAIFSKKWTNWMASATQQYNQTGLKPKVTNLNANNSQIEYHNKLLDVVTSDQLSAIN